MKKEFLFNLVLLVGLNLLIKPFYAFGIDLQVQNRVGLSEYGLYFALFNFSFLFQIITDMGIQQYNSRLIAQNPALPAKYLPHFLSLKAILSLGFFVLAIFFAALMGYLDSRHLPLLFPLLLNQILITLIFYLRSNLSALQYYRIDSLLSAADKLILIIIMGFLLWGPYSKNFSIQYFIYAQCFSFGLTALIAWLILVGKLKTAFNIRWNPAVMVSILKQSWPYALVVFLMTAYTRVDAVMLERLLPGTEGSTEAGIYAFGYRLLDSFNMVGYLFASLLLPMFAKMLKQQDNLGELLKTAHQWMLFLTVSLSFSVLFYGDELSSWMLKDANVYTVSVFQLLIWSSISSGIIYVFGTLLTSNANLRQMNSVFIAGIVLNIAGNIIMIPNYGAWGAALTTVVTQSFVALVEIYLVFRLIPAAGTFFRFSEIWKPILLMTGVYLLFGMADSWLNPFIDWRFSLLLGGICSLAWAETIGAVELKGFFQILKSKKQ
jgi:O-antigen/teichoic acid export membrane protein